MFLMLVTKERISIFRGRHDLKMYVWASEVIHAAKFEVVGYV